MGIIRFAIDNPVKVAVGVILTVLFGLLSIFYVRVQLIPDVDRPVITVTTTWSGASPQEIETEIVDRQEEKLKNVSGLAKMTSTATRNQASILLEFPVDIDKDTAFRDVSDKLRQVTGYPEEVDEPVMSATDSRMAKTIAWMILYSRDGNDVAELKTFIEDNVKPILERAQGISEVSVYGGLTREIQIEIDPYRLASRRLTFRDVENALRRQNENTSAGAITLGKRATSYRTIGEYQSMEDIESTVIAYRSGGPVLIRDVGKAIDGFKKPEGFVRSKGRRVLALPARRETGANVIVAMQNLRTQLELVNREILEPRGLGLELTQVYDETTYIWSAIGLVVKNMFFGGLLAVLVLTLFLRSASAVGIIAVGIPISVIGTMFVITILGRSLNVVLLAGMAFAVGLVVDNAIVVLENIYRHRSMGKSKMDAALDGAREVWGAVLASTLTTMAVFLPIITIQEESGQLFKDIAIAIATAVGLSLVVSVLVIPPMAARFFEASKATAHLSNPRHVGAEGLIGFDLGDRPWGFAVWVSSRVALINETIGRRLAVVGGLSVAAIAGSWLLMPATEYLPTGNKNMVFGFLSTPPGYSVEEFQRMAEIVEDGDPNDPYDGIRPMWEAEIGSELAANLPPVSIALGKDGATVREITPPPIDNFFFVSMSGGAFMGGTSKIPTNVRPLEQAMTRCAMRIPAVFSMFTQSSLFNTGGKIGGNTLDIEIRGDDRAQVVAVSSRVQRKVQELGYDRPRATPGNFALGRPEVQLIPDRERAADLGLDVRDVGFFVRASVDGAFVGEFNDHGTKIDMALTVAGTRRATVEQIAQLPIFTPSGDIVPIASAVRFHRTTAAQQITHIEEMNSVTLSIKPKSGVPLQETMEDLETNVLAPLRESGVIPPTVFTRLAGVADKLTQTQRALLGDFRGVVQQPRLMGLSVLVSMLAILAIVAVALVLTGFLAGPRVTVKRLGMAVVILVIGFLALNPDLALMLFQSRAFLALLITYLLMAALFESFAHPFVIMFTVPLAAVGGFAALRIVHQVSLYNVTTPIQQLDVLTMLGFVILIGIVVNNAILIIHQALNLMRRQKLDPKAAVALSVRMRTRPIVMSAMTSIFGMFPLVVMPGAGSELYRGLGSVVLGGLLVSTVFTLVVVPAMFTLLLDLQAWLSRATDAAPAREFALAGRPAGSPAVATTPPSSPDA
ncbi:MAG: efflux RND transporter permease subunit [Planctomycetes bacterium]|nr:efflux RND transporter permease subunit [Planctomycetota bacterium]